MCDEKGGVLVELVLVVVLLVLYLTGSVKVENRLDARFQRIVASRNLAITKARAP